MTGTSLLEAVHVTFGAAGKSLVVSKVFPFALLAERTTREIFPGGLQVVSEPFTLPTNAEFSVEYTG